MAGKPKTSKRPGADAIERLHATSAGGIVWRRERGAIQIVMVRPANKDAWTLPKGQPAANESLLETAARETREETGLEVAPGEFVGQISYVFSSRDAPGKPLVRIFKRVHYFLMEPRGGNLNRHDHEIDEACWVDLDQAQTRASYKGDREIIGKAQALLKSRA